MRVLRTHSNPTKQRGDVVEVELAVGRRVSDQCECQATASDGPEALVRSWQGALGSSASIKAALALGGAGVRFAGKSDSDPTTSAASSVTGPRLFTLAYTRHSRVFVCIHAA